MANVDHDREQAAQERSAGRVETAQAVELMAEADREDRDRQMDADEENQHPEALAEEDSLRYDSVERRQELAASLEGLPDREAVQARLSADQDQGTLPTAAVAVPPGRSPKARRTRGANGQTKLLQKGISR
jgi:colicin import membrane protein